MYKTFRVFLVLLIIISFNTQMIYYGYAAQLTMKLATTPDIQGQDIAIGSDGIQIIANPNISDVKFQWKLEGPGEFKGDETSRGIYYIPPKNIDGKTAKVTITVTATAIDDRENKAIEKVSFTLVPPTPKSKKTSTGRTVVLGAVAVAALGGGIALVAAGSGNGGSDGDGSCGGVKVGGYCWYLGGWYISCSSVCADHGGYNEATRTYAGSSGTDQNCWDVLTALGAPAATYRYQTDNRADGCSYSVGSEGEGAHWVRDVLPTTAEARGWNRACACNE